MSIQKSPKNIKLQNQAFEPEIVEYIGNGEVQRKNPIKKYFIALLLLLVSILSFGIGLLSRNQTERNVTISYDPSLSFLDQSRATTTSAVKPSKSITPASPSVASVVQSTNEPLPTDGQVVASSKGTRYYYPYCSGAKAISAKNKIVFLTKGDAESAGYTLALNCKVK